MSTGTKVKTKACVKCGQEKGPDEFTKTRRNLKNGEYYLHSQCRQCRSKASAVMSKLRKTAPPQPKNCDCCSKEFKEGENIVLDHDYETSEFRGWICRNCNAGIGQLGDTITGVQKAIKYLKKVEKKWYHLILKR